MVEPNQLGPGETVPVPEAWKAQGEKEAERAALIGQWREHLGAKQRERLEEEGPHAGFETSIGVELAKALTPAEREELMAHEQMEYRRLKPLAEARRTQRDAYVRAGGTGEEFDEMWTSGGREMTIAEIASGGNVGPSPGEFSSPY